MSRVGTPGAAGETAQPAKRRHVYDLAEGPALYQRRADGRYRRASADQVITAARRLLADRLAPGAAIRGGADVADYLCHHFADRPREVFCVLFLDADHRVIALEELFAGTLEGCAVYPREIARRALALNAAAVILAHNHPGGAARASRADRAITRQIAAALALFDIETLDHLIVAGGCFYSFAARGAL